MRRSQYTTEIYFAGYNGGGIEMIRVLLPLISTVGFMWFTSAVKISKKYIFTTGT